MLFRSKKVGIVGKFGTKFGATLRKIVKKFEVTKKAKYLSPFTGKECVRRQAVGIWHCKQSDRKIAGGAWTLNTAPAIACKTNVNRLRRLQELAKKEV